jgi:hypothetical protein
MVPRIRYREVVVDESPTRAEDDEAELKAQLRRWREEEIVRLLTNHRDPTRPVTSEDANDSAFYLRARIKEAGCSLSDYGTTEEELDRLSSQRELVVLRYDWGQIAELRSTIGRGSQEEARIWVRILQFLTGNNRDWNGVADASLLGDEVTIEVVLSSLEVFVQAQIRGCV